MIFSNEISYFKLQSAVPDAKISYFEQAKVQTKQDPVQYSIVQNMTKSWAIMKQYQNRNNNNKQDINKT